MIEYEVTEQVTEDEIEFVPTARKAVFAKVLETLYDEMVAWCEAHNRDVADFLDFAVQRELDYQNGDLRYVIADLLKQREKEGLA